MVVTNIKNVSFVFRCAVNGALVKVQLTNKNESKKSVNKNLLSLAVFVALTGATSSVSAQTAQEGQNTQNKDDKQQSENLGKVVVTGSLIPQSQKENAKPVTVITGDSVQAKGFTSVTEAVQQSAQSTGGVQGGGSSGAVFTKGADTVSLFGLAPGFTKYLINGRPMANYPALYNGSDVFNSITGIPTDLVDRVEILPGGQSSLYGSDAIAGVVNFILKKKVAGPVFSVRYGDYQHGGGRSVRGSFADQLTAGNGRFNALIGLQIEKADPIWSRQRDLTKQFFQNGHTWNKYNPADPDPRSPAYEVPSPPIASRDFVVIRRAGGYLFADPNNCANTTAGFGGTEGLRTRPGSGQYCGSFYSPGYRTLKNGLRSQQFSSHMTFDINSNTQLYADFLYDHHKVRYNTGSNYLWWGSSDLGPSGYFYDKATNQRVSLQRAFTPEDVGDWDLTSSKDDTRAWTGTLGISGTLGSSAWDYDVSFTHNQYDLKSTSIDRMADKIDNWFLTNVLGPNLGNVGAYATYAPNYAKFYSLMTPGDFWSFMQATQSHSHTYDNMARAQFTNGSLFHLPAGDAGIALAVEGGTQGWKYTPDPLALNGSVWGRVDTVGGGSRSRWATVGEMRFPIWSMLTITASGRYDRFNVSGNRISKPTYTLGVEFRPWESLLIRGQYGTAFKLPDLAAQFQQPSGFYSFVTDYYSCSQLGFDPSQISKCPAPYNSYQYRGTISGNPKLQPINAKSWSYGVVWAPINRLSLSLDYLRWNINNEVSRQSADQLMLDEYACRTGQLPSSSGTCAAALSQVTRASNGDIQSIYLTKVNVSTETLKVLMFNGHYVQPIGSLGKLSFDANWNKNISHMYKQYQADPLIDILNDPWYSTDPKWKANLSATWSIGRFSTTLYGDRIGSTPNYRAANISAYGYAIPGAGKLPAFTRYNGSVNYKMDNGLTLSLMVNNLTDKMAPRDDTYPGTSSAPYNSANFNPLGRSYYLQARWDLGAMKK